MYQKQKLSRMEVILIAAILAMSAFFIVLALEWPARATARRDDALRVNTALSAARINSNNGQDCVVEDCPGGDCAHKHGKYWIGYLDISDNKIRAEKTAGYNEERKIVLDDKVYRGRPGSLVVEVRSDGNNVSARWVEGKEK